MSTKIRFIVLLLGLALTSCVAGDDVGGDVGNDTADADFRAGKKQFETHCLTCHNGALPEAQTIEALRLYPPERLVASMNSGVMSTAALPLSGQEIRQVAYYLTEKMPGTKIQAINQFLCNADFPAATDDDAASWTSWGGENHNQRFQLHERDLNRDNVANLELKWAFAFPDATRARSQPTVTAEVTYVGSQEGTVYALNTDTGCLYWTFDADAEVRGEVRGAIQLHTHPDTGKRTLLFGDFKANAYSIDADTGELFWKTPVHDHPLATITGSVIADDDKVYVPVSSTEIVPAGRSDYACCTFRGALVAINLGDGSIAWRTYTTPEPVSTGKNSAGVDRFGPSGAPIWSTPTLDGKRNLVIATTGQNYTSPATGTSDAVIAMDTTSGEIQWASQLTENDAWNGACVRKTANCPEEDGPDFDIGASAILMTTRDNKDLLLVGAKSGLVHALDPGQNGKILWQQRVGSGGTMGGVHWGMSTDGNRLYVGVSDLPTNNRYKEGEPYPGLHALDPVSGEFLWRKSLPNTCPADLKFLCWPGISAAISSSPGVVFAGGLDGILRAFDATNGDILWTYNTHRKYSAVNGVDGFGGAIEADGPVIANGQLFVTSGYDKWAELPGNVLLVFSLADE
jgi:polyvinyl alcohol dehydrogenase (cytochrome)